MPGLGDVPLVGWLFGINSDSWENREIVLAVTPHIIRRIACWVLTIILIDLCYNILPALKDGHGDSRPFLSVNLLWVLTSVIGVGGVCVWAYLRSFPTTKLIPTRDPRIGECLSHHD